MSASTAEMEPDNAEPTIAPGRRFDCQVPSSGLSESCAVAEALADMAHEIRNPLTSLLAAAQAMRSADEGQRTVLLGIIEADVARLDRLVDEISSSIPLDAGFSRRDASEFDIFGTVRNLVAHIAQGPISAGIDVIVDIPPERATCIGLEGRLTQVLANLLDNALSLSEEGDALRVWMRRRGNEVVVAVEDTGPGIPQGAADKVFQRHYTTRPGHTTGTNGGLGLAIARRIVEAHGGTIQAENIRPTENDVLSEPFGARFTMVLPL